MSIITDSTEIPVVFTDAGPPLVFSVPARTELSGLDFTTVISASLNVTRPDGTKTVWTPATILAVNAGEMILGYAFQAGDCAQAGTYTIKPLLTIPGGATREYPVALIVEQV